MNKLLTLLVFLLILPISLACDFEHDLLCDYSNVDWTNVEDYTHVDLSKIPSEKWQDVDMSLITGDKVKEIPAEYFDPKRLDVESLKFATEEQIQEHISEFDNLRNADPGLVSNIFSREPYSVRIDISGATNIQYVDGVLRGDFPQYDPKKYPKDKFSQKIVGYKVIITQLDSESEEIPGGSISIAGAESFDVNEDGSLSIKASDDKETSVEGNQKGTVTLDDGTVIDYENTDRSSFSANGDFSSVDGYVKITYPDGTSQQLVGMFQKNKGVFTLYDYNGKQSAFMDIDKELMVQSTGRDLSIYDDGNLHDVQNYVSYSNDNFRMNGAGQLSLPEFGVISKTDSYFEQIDGFTKAEGIIEYDTPTYHYYGLSEGSILTSRTDENGKDSVSIDGSEDGEIAVLERKVQYGDLLGEGGFLNDGVPLTFSVSKTDGKIDMQFDMSSIQFLSEIEKDPYLVFLNSNDMDITLGNGQQSIKIGSDNGILYNDGKEELYLVSPQDSFAIFGNDIDTLQNVVSKQIGAYSVEMDVQQVGIQKLYTMKSYDILTSERAIENFNEMRSFIQQTYEDPSASIAAETSFMLANIGNLVDNVGAFADDSEETIQNSRAITDNIEGEVYTRIRENIYNDPLIKFYLYGEMPVDGSVEVSAISGVGPTYKVSDTEAKSDISNIDMLLLQKASNDPGKLNEYKDMMEQQLTNLIIYENSDPRYDDPKISAEFQNPVYGPIDGGSAQILPLEQILPTQDQEDILGQISSSTYAAKPLKNNQNTIDAYRALLHLEDTQLDYNDENNYEISSSTSTFTNRKVQLTYGLAAEYAENEEVGKGLSVIDQLQVSFDDYKQQNPSGLDYSDPFVKQDLDAMEMQIQLARASVANNGFNKIQMDIYTSQQRIDALMQQREGWKERVDDAQGTGEKIVTGAFSGGLGKSVVKDDRLSYVASAVFGPISVPLIQSISEDFENAKIASSQLTDEFGSYSVGSYAINSLLQHGASGEKVKEWIDDDSKASTEDMAKRMLVINGLATPSQQEMLPEDITSDYETNIPSYQAAQSGEEKYTFELDGKTYVASSADLSKVYTFLEDTKSAARATYYESPYSGDVKALIGEKNVPSYGVNPLYSGKDLELDDNIQLSELKDRVDQELEFSDVGKVLNYMDEVTSPASVTISAATGGAGMSFSGATGIAGVGFGILEDAAISGATGTFLMATGLEGDLTAEIASGIGIGVAFGSVNLRGLSNSASSIAEDAAATTLRISDMPRGGISSSQVRRTVSPTYGVTLGQTIELPVGRGRYAGIVEGTSPSGRLVVSFDVIDNSGRPVKYYVEYTPNEIPSARVNPSPSRTPSSSGLHNRIVLYPESKLDQLAAEGKFQIIEDGVPFLPEQEVLINYFAKGAGRQEHMVVDMTKEKFVNAYDKILNNIKRQGISGDLGKAAAVYDYMNSNIVYDKAFTSKMLSPEASNIRPYTDIVETNLDNKGVCRHTGILSAPMIGKMIKSGEMGRGAKVMYNSGTGHAWGELIINRERYVIDNAQHYFGPTKLPIKTDSYGHVSYDMSKVIRGQPEVDQHGFVLYSGQYRYFDQSAASSAVQ